MVAEAGRPVVAELAPELVEGASVRGRVWAAAAEGADKAELAPGFVRGANTQGREGQETDCPRALMVQ